MKWIDILELERWSGSIGAREVFPELIADLIRASNGAITNFRFPSGNKSQVRGFDGHLEANSASAYVPNGLSFWEFGVNAGELSKFTSDFKKRVDKQDADFRKNATFVFVTPQTWDNPKKPLATVLQDLNEAGNWAEVRIIDGTQLEQWLKQSPAVAARYARSVVGNYPARGARSTDEFWEEFSRRYTPTLTEEVLLAGRKDVAGEVLAFLSGDAPGVQNYVADAPDEVVAFVIAAIRKAAPEVRYFLEARTLVVDSEEAARELATRTGLALIACGLAQRQAGYMSGSVPVIVGSGRDVVGKNNRQLARPAIRDLAAALQTTGMTEERAESIARTCGRSVTILARRMPNGVGSTPAWASGGAQLVPALLAGAWDANVPPDTEAVASLAGGNSYPTVEANLASFLRSEEPFIEREQSVWRVRAPVDAFTQLGHLVTPSHLERFKTALIEVFSQAGEAPTEDTPFGTNFETSGRHSSWIREGLATTLLQIAVFSSDVDLVTPGGSPQEFVDQVVRDLPGLKSDLRVLASLRNELPYLAEAAPNPFMVALEQLLEGQEGSAQNLFTERNDGLGGGVMPSVLWALETLAWDPKYLTKATLLLTRLASIDPGGALSNRPINSLREIFVVWGPNTNASLSQRRLAIDAVVRTNADVGWQLVRSLLPKSHDSASVTAKPRYRESGLSEREVLTYGIVWKGQRYVVELACKLASLAPTRWPNVVEAVPNMQRDVRESVFESLEAYLKTADGNERLLIWDTIREEIARNEAHRDAPWAMAEEGLFHYRKFEAMLRPKDSIESSIWLFNDWYPSIGSSDDLDDERLRELRGAAIAEIAAEHGKNGVIDLVERAKLPRFVAQAVVDQSDTLQTTYDLLCEVIVRQGDVWGDFREALSGSAYLKFGVRAAVPIRTLAMRRLAPPSDLARLYFHWPDEPSTWRIVSRHGGEVESCYWKKKPAWRLNAGVEAVEEAMRRYIEVGRASAGILACDASADRVDLALLVEVLNATLKELSAGQAQVGGLFKHAVERIFVALRGRADIDRGTLVSLEFAYFQLLEGQPLALYEELASSPSLFVEMISQVYRSKSDVGQPISDEQKSRARAAFQVVYKFRTLPGFVNGVLDVGALLAWVRTTRTLGEAADRQDIVDQHIGWLLAHAPIDPDGGWPVVAVRDVIEEVKSSQVERGIEIERHNMRGVVSKAIYEGGAQERDLAAESLAWAAKAEAWPRTSQLLERIASHWDWLARQEDTEARHDEMRDS